jgi:hypothetical protein
MSLFRWIVPGLGLLLELLLLLRSVRGHLFRKYYLFFSYILSVMLSSALLVVVLVVTSDPREVYQRWYWPLQFITLVAGYGILLEILNHVLAPYPGAERFARMMGIAAFGGIFCFALIAPRVVPQWSAGTVIEFERDLRCVQALFICGLFAVMAYYAIPMGKNMKGMVVGYGLYVVTSLMSLAVRSYAGTPFNRVWNIVQPLSFDASLLIWVMALWSYCPNPVPDHTIQLEQDYEALVARTKSVMTTIRTYLGKARA